MTTIENGIKQPLRWYDSLDKQNFRRIWANDSGMEKEQCLINPNNTIIPFQLRRKTSMNPVAIFDLYKYNAITEDFEYELDLFDIIPNPTTSHLRIVQSGSTDNIIWNPKSSFSQTLDCGLYYCYISDGVNEWYSEIFQVYNFSSIQSVRLAVSPIVAGITHVDILGYTDNSGNNHIITTRKII